MFGSEKYISQRFRWYNWFSTLYLLVLSQEEGKERFRERMSGSRKKGDEEDRNALKKERCMRSCNYE